MGSWYNWFRSLFHVVRGEQAALPDDSASQTFVNFNVRKGNKMYRAMTNLKMAYLAEQKKRLKNGYAP